MPLTEKTLELNVTHELLALGQGIWQILWASALRSGLRAGVVSPPMYASGISLRDEMKSGWDVAIEVPSMGATPARVAFLQFKLGQARSYSKSTGTLFPPGMKGASAHVTFGINNNSNCNQHEVLRKTAIQSGVPEAAIYALPLFTQETEVRSHLGDLVARTSFFSVPDVDASVLHDPIVTGKARKIAVSKSDIHIREVRSEPAVLKAPDCGGELLGEIVSVRLHRAMSALWVGGDGSPRAVLRTGRATAREVAQFLVAFTGAEIDQAEEVFGFRLVRAGNTAARVSPSALTGPAGINSLRRQRLEAIAQRVAPFITQLRSGYFPPFVPELPPLRFLVTASQEGLRYRVDSDGYMGGAARLSYVVV